MIIIAFFVFHWYFSLFFQSFFNHRYAAHQMFSMSKGWEKFFFFMSWIANGSSYLSPNAYGILHRMHHAYADQEKDPHSPRYSANLFDMMWKTKKIYTAVYDRKVPIEKKFLKNVPEWKKFDDFAESWGARLGWAALYITIFVLFATHWSQFLLLPVVLTMGPVHGAIINWFAHKFGYRNFEVSDTSKNFLPFDFLMWGESYHNNHHKFGSRPNFGVRWFEIDPMYPLILLFNAIGIIKLKKNKERDGVQIPDLKFTNEEVERIQQALANLKLPSLPKNILPQEKLDICVKRWDALVNKDWKGDLADYVSHIQARQIIQVYMENVNANMKRKLDQIIAPIDATFKKQMAPWPAPVPALAHYKKDYFWISNSIYPMKKAS